MEKLKKLLLLDSDTNSLYEILVTEEVYNRASMDMVFAANLLQKHINKENNDLVTTSQYQETGPSTSTGTIKSNQEKSNAQSAIHNWTKKEVLLLISTYKEHQLQFMEENSCKSEIWLKVANDMASALAEHGLPPIDERKCRSKMDTLKRHYKNLKDSNKKSGNHQITWTYYDEMEELFGEQPWVQPLTTAGSNISNKLVAEIKRPPAKRQKNLKDYCDQLVELRKRRNETREQHHHEKIAALNRLTDVVAQIIEKKKQV